jgi:hypothetical protein
MLVLFSYEPNEIIYHLYILIWWVQITPQKTIYLPFFSWENDDAYIYR